MRGRRGSVAIVVSIIVATILPSAASAAAMAGGLAASPAVEVAAPGADLPFRIGRSEPRRSIDPLAIARPVQARQEPARVLNPTVPDVVRPADEPPAADRPHTAGAPGEPLNIAIDATIPTSTTLTAPAGPVAWPAQVHLEADVNPPPATYLGYTPGVAFTLDGSDWQAAPLDETGHAVLDGSLPVGTYEIAAVFRGLGEYDASASEPATVEVVQLPGLATGIGGPSVQSSHGFAGLSATTNQYSPDPSPDVAVGPDDIIQVTNAGFRFLTRSGEPMFDVALGDLFLEDDNFDTHARQPRLVFDDQHDRWIATEIAWGNLGHLLVAISSSPDPSEIWWVYDFVMESNLGPTNPAIGLSSNKIAIGLDAYEMSAEAFIGSRVLIIDAASIIDGDDVIRYGSTTADAGQRSWRPAVGQSTGGTLHAVASSDAGHILHLTVTGTVAAGLSFAVEDLTAGPPTLPGVGEPVYAHVAGGSSVTLLLGLPLGPTAAVWQSGSLWFVSTRGCLPEGGSGTVACVRVTELSTGATTGVVQDFVVNADGWSTYDGGIGITGAGDLGLVFTRSTGLSIDSDSGSPLTLFAAIQKASDPPNSMREPALIESGSGFFGLSVWSPTTPIVRDPLDPAALWQGGAVNTSVGWRTWVSRLSVASATPGGSLVLNGGRLHANALRIGVGGTLGAADGATRMRISNSSATAGGDLSLAKEVAIADRIAWSLADPATGGTTGTGARVVYVQWGDGAGGWSAVEQATLAVNRPLGSSFVPLTPARLLDTRTGNGLSDRFLSGVPRTFRVTGRGGVPTGAVAVTGNLTVTGQTRAGYVFLGPSATSTPTSSTLNFPVGDTRANGVTVKVSGTGRLAAVYKGPAGSSTHLIFDVTGYFVVSDPNAPVGTTWLPVEPLRVLDTRFDGPAGRFLNGAPRALAVTGFGIPATATAVTGNVTITGQTSAGYLFVGPSTGANPSSSTINVPRRDTRANNTTVRLGPGGTLSAVWKGAPGSGSHLIFDVTGYFEAGPWGATYVPLTPVRALDTRVGTGLSGPFVHAMPQPLPLAGVGGVPAADTLGITGNATVTGQTSAGYVFVGPNPIADPTSSTLNFPLGDTRANGLDVALSAGQSVSLVFRGVVGSTTHLLLDVTGYFR